MSITIILRGDRLAIRIGQTIDCSQIIVGHRHVLRRGSSTRRHRECSGGCLTTSIIARTTPSTVCCVAKGLGNLLPHRSRGSPGRYTPRGERDTPLLLLS